MKRFFLTISIWVAGTLGVAQISSPALAAQEPAVSAGSDRAAGAEVAVAQALAQKLDESTQWLNLINYRRDFLWFKRSQADGAAFFMSANGKKDPRAELVATIDKIFDAQGIIRNGTSAEPAQCLFPGRALWLKRMLPEISWPQQKCERFENFRAVLNAHSATYVFSSYYINNPSSAYGHSFLRLNRTDGSRGERKYELLDFGVGYSAVPTTDNGLLFTVMGLTGFFAGRFEAHPYYYKVREYNDFENRDLWEYDLNLSPDEIELLVAHIYELDQGGFDYLYFTENCAYRILAALDSVRPSLRLIEKTKFATIPGDTMGTVANIPGLVKEVHYRPSGRAIFGARLETLSVEQRKTLRQFMQDEKIAELLNGSEDEKRILLDAAMDYVDFKFADDVLKQKGRFRLKKQILLARSEISLSSAPLVVSQPARAAPDLAHGSSMLYLGGEAFRGSSRERLGLRLALHDLLDPVSGYPASSQIVMGQFDFSFDNKNHRTQVEDLNVIEIVSLSPLSELSQSLSWRLKFSLTRSYEESCDNCLPLMFSGGIGFAKDFIPGLTTGFFLRGSAAYSPSFFHDKHIVGAGPAILARYFYTDKLSLLAEAWYRYDYKATQTDFREAKIGGQYQIQKDLGLRANWQADRRYSLDLNYYF